MNRPDGFAGLRHVALFVREFTACENFYVSILGMRIEWRPDADNVYLCSGCDNLALHRAQSPAASNPDSQQPKLDHIGFVINSEKAVDEYTLVFL